MEEFENQKNQATQQQNAIVQTSSRPETQQRDQPRTPSNSSPFPSQFNFVTAVHVKGKSQIHFQELIDDYNANKLQKQQQKDKNSKISKNKKHRNSDSHLSDSNNDGDYNQMHIDQRIQVQNGNDNLSASDHSQYQEEEVKIELRSQDNSHVKDKNTSIYNQNRSNPPRVKFLSMSHSQSNFRNSFSQQNQRQIQFTGSHIAQSPASQENLQNSLNHQNFRQSFTNFKSGSMVVQNPLSQNSNKKPTHTYKSGSSTYMKLPTINSSLHLLNHNLTGSSSTGNKKILHKFLPTLEQSQLQNQNFEQVFNAKKLRKKTQDILANIVDKLGESQSHQKVNFNNKALQKTQKVDKTLRNTLIKLNLLNPFYKGESSSKSQTQDIELQDYNFQQDTFLHRTGTFESIREQTQPQTRTVIDSQIYNSQLTSGSGSRKTRNRSLIGFENSILDKNRSISMSGSQSRKLLERFNGSSNQAKHKSVAIFKPKKELKHFFKSMDINLDNELNTNIFYVQPDEDDSRNTLHLELFDILSESDQNLQIQIGKVKTLTLVKDQISNTWDWQECKLVGIDYQNKSEHKLVIQLVSTDNQLITKNVSRLNLIFSDLEDIQQFKVRRRLALELRQIYYSVIKYIKSVNTMIEAEDQEYNLLEKHMKYMPDSYTAGFTALIYQPKIHLKTSSLINRVLERIGQMSNLQGFSSDELDQHKNEIKMSYQFNVYKYAFDLNNRLDLTFEKVTKELEQKNQITKDRLLNFQLVNHFMSPIDLRLGLSEVFENCENQRVISNEKSVIYNFDNNKDAKKEMFDFLKQRFNQNLNLIKQAYPSANQLIYQRFFTLIKKVETDVQRPMFRPFLTQILSAKSKLLDNKDFLPLNFSEFQGKFYSAYLSEIKIYKNIINQANQTLIQMINEEAKVLMAKFELPTMLYLVDELQNFDRLYEVYKFRDGKRREAQQVMHQYKSIYGEKSQIDEEFASQYKQNYEPYIDAEANHIFQQLQAQLNQSKFSKLSPEHLNEFRLGIMNIKTRYIYQVKLLNIILESNLRVSLQESYSRLGKFMLKFVNEDKYSQIVGNWKDPSQKQSQESSSLKHQDSGILLKQRSETENQLRDIQRISMNFNFKNAGIIGGQNDPNFKQVQAFRERIQRQIKELKLQMSQEKYQRDWITQSIFQRKLQSKNVSIFYTGMIPIIQFQVSVRKFVRAQNPRDRKQPIARQALRDLKINALKKVITKNLTDLINDAQQAFLDKVHYILDREQQYSVNQLVEQYIKTDVGFTISTPGKLRKSIHSPQKEQQENLDKDPHRFFKSLKKELGFFEFDLSEFQISPGLRDEMFRDLTMLFKDPLKKLKNLDQINLIDSDVLNFTIDDSKLYYLKNQDPKREGKLQIKTAKMLYSEMSEILALIMQANIQPFLAFLIMLAQYEYIILHKDIGYIPSIEKLFDSSNFSVVQNEYKRLLKDIEDITLKLPDHYTQGLFQLSLTTLKPYLIKKADKLR